MPNLEWEVAHDLITPGGTIPMNQVVPLTSGGVFQGGRIWQIQPDYKIIPTLRLTSDNISQADGSVIHPRYKTGMIATFSVEYKTSVTGTYPGEVFPAIGSDLREMHELLMGALDSIRDLPADALGVVQRLMWLPTDYGDHRMLDKIVLNAWPDQSRDESSNRVTLALETQYPYAIDTTPLTIPPFTGAATIVNAGNTSLLPVIQVSATSVFDIKNLSVVDDDGNPYRIHYNAGLPGANPIVGFAEIDCFRGTIFQGGDGADMIAGIDPTLSDLDLPLVPGSNSIEVTGTTATFIANNSWT